MRFFVLLSFLFLFSCQAKTVAFLNDNGSGSLTWTLTVNKPVLNAWYELILALQELAGNPEDSSLNPNADPLLLLKEVLSENLQDLQGIKQYQIQILSDRSLEFSLDFEELSAFFRLFFPENSQGLRRLDVRIHPKENNISQFILEVAPHEPEQALGQGEAHVQVDSYEDLLDLSDYFLAQSIPDIPTLISQSSFELEIHFPGKILSHEGGVLKENSLHYRWNTEDFFPPQLIEYYAIFESTSS